MTDVETLYSKINERCAHWVQQSVVALGELTIDVLPDHLHEICYALRDSLDFDFQMLVDVCGVDYLHYGLSEWETESATATGFERGVDRRAINHPHLTQPRYAAVYHLLSLRQNHRLRIRVLLDEHDLKVPS